MNIYKKLQKVRVQLQNMNLKMSGENKYSNYKYYELGDFLPAVNKLCNDQGLFTQFKVVDENKMAKLIVIDVDEPESKLVFSSKTAKVEIGKKKDGSGGAEPIQNLGGQITYMRRYLMMMAFEIVESDLVEKIKRDETEEVSEKDLERLEKVETFKDLKKLGRELKRKYKVKLIKPLYLAKKKDLEEKPEPEKETK